MKIKVIGRTGAQGMWDFYFNIDDGTFDGTGTAVCGPIVASEAREEQTDAVQGP